ncbi:MAG: LytTR family DNA-binding domain-containing protein [Syntrophomonas sp.]
MKVLILEDEEYTREFIKKLILDNLKDCSVFDTPYGTDAIQLAKQHCPDLILLDIELDGQDLNGLDIAKQIYSFNKEAFLVFITGYPQYAVNSFAVHPFSYVLKPININKFIGLIREISELAEKKHLRSLDRLVVKTKRGIVHIPKEQIIFIEKENGFILIHTYTGTHQLSGALSDLERQLGNDFIRVHRSYIINLKHVIKVKEVFDRSYEIEFDRFPQKALMSRYHFRRYKKLFDL